MKRLTIPTILVLLSLVLAACGGAAPTAAPAAPAATSAPAVPAATEATAATSAPAATSALTTTAAAPATGGGAKTPITVAAGAVGQELQLTQAAADRYMKAHPDVTVKVLQTPDLATDRLGLYLQFFQAKSTEVDVYQIDVIWPGDR